MTEWINIEEDIPLKDPMYDRLSLPINILMKDGTIYKNEYCTIDNEEYYTEDSKHLPYKKVKAWCSV